MPTNGFVQPFVGIISFLSVFHGTPEGIRTPDPLVRSQILYPAELQAHIVAKVSCNNKYYITLAEICQGVFEKKNKISQRWRI